jgi:metallophosphoesterase (TIGR00282 family)
MKILFIGDIVGKPGRNAVKALLPKITERYKIDFTIANGENAAGGFGITEDTAKELFSLGIQIITTGNHVWDKKESIPFLQKEDRVLRPLNYPEGVPGYGSAVISGPGGRQVGVINLSGRVYMGLMDDPFRAGLREVEKLREKTPVIVVDMHAEATSEKIAMGYYLDGKASAVIGTHTHVITADERILPKGTAFISDAGMTGPRDSIIGVNKDQVIERFLLQMPTRFEIPGGAAVFCGVIIDVDEETGLSKSITRLQLTHP